MWVFDVTGLYEYEDAGFAFAADHVHGGIPLVRESLRCGSIHPGLVV
jgi:hypothetical protein